MFEMGMEGLEPTRLAAHDSKSCASASSATSPANADYTTGERFAKQRKLAGDDFILGLNVPVSVAS